jgi:glycosyltransferase involved in cell wall biosynthesis
VLRLTGHRPEIVTVTFMGQNFPYAPVAEVAAAAAQRRRGERFDAGVFEKFGIPAEPYLLHVGGGQWYKNRPGVIAIHRALRSRLGSRAPRLLLVGPPCAAPDVEMRSEIDNETLAGLYSGAELLLFPSLAEGFGWPIIEAQACGCRVLTTAQDPMVEVGGKAAFYLQDPSDVATGAREVERLLMQDEAGRAGTVRAGIENAARFSTERMVREYLAIYREVLGS